MFLKAQLGDYVTTWFDTGAMGMTTIWGVVTASGPKAVTVTWESGLTNRVSRDNPRDVEDVSDIESIDARARRSLVPYLPTKKCADRACNLAATPHRHLARTVRPPQDEQGE